MAKSIQEEVARLTRYLDSVKTRMNGDIPERHKNQQEAYKMYLALEFKRTSKKIESLKS